MQQKPDGKVRPLSRRELVEEVKKAVAEVEVVDLHTHLYDLRFQHLMLRGIDDLLT